MIYSKDFAVCPHCNAHTGHEVSHLYGGRQSHSFGPWYCDECGGAFEGTALAPGEVTIRALNEKAPQNRYMALLKMEAADRTIYFVVGGAEDADRPIEDRETQESIAFLYESHSCPTNWMADIAAVIENGDCDPHGFLTFVRAVAVPRDFEDNDDIAWPRLFPEAFPEEKIIDGTIAATAIEAKQKSEAAASTGLTERKLATQGETVPD